MNYYLLIPVFVIFLLLFPVPLLFKMSGNILRLEAVVVIYIFGLKVKGLVLKGGVKGLDIYEDKKEIPNGKPKGQMEENYIKQLFFQVADKMRLQLLQVNYNLGLGDAFESSMIAGWLNTALLIVMTRIKSEKPTASMIICDNLAYNSTVFESAVMIKAKITLFDLVYSLFYSVILILYRKSIKCR